MVSGCGNRKASHNTSDAINDSIAFSKDPYALHFEEELSKERPSEFVLNDLVQKTTFIPLDSKEESPLLADFNFSVHAIDDQFIVSSGVMDKALPALLYDSSGRFIKPLIRRGRGPYEITGAVPMPSLNRSSNVLSVFGGQKIVSYSLVEEKAKDMRVDRYILSGVLLDDGNYVAISGAYRFNEEDPYLYFFDPEGKLLKSLNYPAGTKKAYQLKEGESSGPTDKYILSNNHLDQALFHDLFNDTVYRISGLDRMDPYIVLNRKNLLPMHKDVNNPEARGRTIHIHRLAETRDYFFISYNYLKEYHTSIWEKSTGELMANISESPLLHPFSAQYRLNDGTLIWVGIVGFADDKIYGILSANDAVSVIPGITENDNPVLMVMDLSGNSH